MPLQLPDNDSAPFYIIGTDAKGVRGAQLASGATIGVTSADPNTAALTLDPTPQPAPDGTATIASGTVNSPATVAQPNVPINLVAQVTNADGTPGDSATDTVTVTPGSEAAIGEVFGAATPVSVVPSARKR